MSTTKVGELSANDRVLMVSANENIVRAQTTREFVRKHLLSVYGITETQAIEANGDILELKQEKPSNVDADAIEDDDAIEDEATDGPEPAAL